MRTGCSRQQDAGAVLAIKSSGGAGVPSWAVMASNASIEAAL
jgi:hypothetical protein